MDDYDDEEMAFCEESHQLVEEDESELLQAVFDEENAISNEGLRKESLSDRNKPKKKVRMTAVSIRREVWIVNPKLMAKQSTCSAEKMISSAEDQHVPLNMKNPYQEVPKSIKIEENLSCENSSKKMKNFTPSKLNKILINNNNNYCNFCGKEFCKEKLLKDHIKSCSCNENFLNYCEPCVEKFAKRSPPGFSYKLDHSYCKPTEDALQCNLCGLNFNETSQLQVHLRTEHVLQLREILKNCFHVETKKELKEDNLIVQVLPEDGKIKVKLERKDEILRNDAMN